MFFLQQFNSEKKFKNRNKSPGKIIRLLKVPWITDAVHAPKLTWLGSRKVAFHLRTNKLSKFVSPESQQYAFINIGKDVLLFIVGKENMQNSIHRPKIFLSKDIAREKKKLYKKQNKNNPLSSRHVYLFFWLVCLLQRGWELPHNHNDQGYSLSRWIGQVGAPRDIQVLVRYRCPVFSVWRANLLAEVRKLDLWWFSGKLFHIKSYLQLIPF